MTDQTRYSVIKLEGTREGWAVFDATINGTVAGTRCTTKREALGVLDEIQARGLTTAIDAASDAIDALRAETPVGSWTRSVEAAAEIAPRIPLVQYDEDDRRIKAERLVDVGFVLSITEVPEHLADFVAARLGLELQALLSEPFDDLGSPEAIEVLEAAGLSDADRVILAGLSGHADSM